MGWYHLVFCSDLPVMIPADPWCFLTWPGSKSCLLRVALVNNRITSPIVPVLNDLRHRLEVPCGAKSTKLGEIYKLGMGRNGP